MAAAGVVNGRSREDDAEMRSQQSVKRPRTNGVVQADMPLTSITSTADAVSSTARKELAAEPDMSSDDSNADIDAEALAKALQPLCNEALLAAKDIAVPSDSDVVLAAAPEPDVAPMATAEVPPVELQVPVAKVEPQVDDSDSESDSSSSDSDSEGPQPAGLAATGSREPATIEPAGASASEVADVPLGVSPGESTSQVPEANAAEPSPRVSTAAAVMSRTQVIRAIFRLLDATCSGFAGSAVLHRFASLNGFEGSTEDWEDEYGSLCVEWQISEARGFNEGKFTELVSDRSEKGVFCSNKELGDIFRRMGQPAVIVKEDAAMEVAGTHAAPQQRRSRSRSPRGRSS